MINWNLMIWAGFFLVLCAWDAARRYIDAKRFNETEIARLVRLEQENEKAHQQIQNLAQRLSVQGAATASRMRREIS